MPILKVMLNKLSSDWQVARAVLEDEYKTIDTTLNKIRTRYEFVAHLLDVHRLSCEVCAHTGGLALAVPVRSDRDTANLAARSAGARLSQQKRKVQVSPSTQTTTTDSMMCGLHSYSSDRGIADNNGDDYDDDSNNIIGEMAFPLAMTCHGEDGELQTDEKPSNERGIKEEDHYDESIGEKDKDEQREEGAVEGWLDNGRPSSLQDQIPDTHQPLTDEQPNLMRTNQVSYLVIKQEGVSQEHCDADMDDSRNVATSHLRHEEALPIQHFGSDPLWNLKRTNQVPDLLIKQERDSQVHCDENMECSRNESTFPQRHEESVPTQGIESDGKTVLENISVPSRSTQDSDISNPEVNPMDLHVCESSIDSPKEVQNIYRSERLRKPFQCPSCRKKYSCKSTFHTHLKTHSELIAHPGDHPCRCLKCQEKFSRKFHLSRHITIHTDQKPFQCSVCNKSFTRKGELNSHEKIHQGEKPYQSSSSDKRFSHEINLSQHVQTHIEEKPYQCSLCNKAFMWTSLLSRHMIIHTGEKPYQCSSCSRRFTQKVHLKSHMRIHTGEKPFQCQICNKRFTNKSNLKLHNRTHTGEKPFRCPFCTKSFAQTGTLQTHVMRTHTGERRYQC